MVSDITLLECVGSGTYGSVFRALQRSSGKCIAVKSMEKHAEGNLSTGIALTIVREAALLRSLRHDNVVELQGIVIGRLRIHMLLELCCCSLRQHLYDLQATGLESVDAAQLASFSRQLLTAIDFCHEHRCLHRDIKPDNLLLDCARRTLKLADFGMARPIGSAPPPPAGGSGGGGEQQLTPGMVTPRYRPPELILGDPAYDRPVDLWGAGCVIAEMVNLEPAFAAETEVLVQSAPPRPATATGRSRLALRTVEPFPPARAPTAYPPP